MSKFEQQKQRLREAIYSKVESCQGYEIANMKIRSWLIKLVNELQPERPTCATCNKLHTWKEEVDYNLIIDRFSCKRYHGFPINAPDIQSCIHHPDYEKAANK